MTVEGDGSSPSNWVVVLSLVAMGTSPSLPERLKLRRCFHKNVQKTVLSSLDRNIHKCGVLVCDSFNTSDENSKIHFKQKSEDLIKLQFESLQSISQCACYWAEKCIKE